MNFKSKQALFDYIGTFLLAQGRRSVSSDVSSYGSCFYRHPDGLKCAVGCVIPDEFYKPNMEGNSIRLLIEKFSSDHLFPTYIKKYQDFLFDAQIIHDDIIWNSKKDFCNEWIKLGIRYKLKTKLFKEIK
jgi:hypothetical protein